MSDSPVKVGVIGCGNVSTSYLRGSRQFQSIDVVACADRVPERAQSRASEFGVSKACSVEELLADPDVELVLNLTHPESHAQVNLAALEAGKCVYSEKPLAIRLEEARDILVLARKYNLRVGCAPDAVLGVGLQMCRKLIDDGAIGRPIAGAAAMLCPGHESWHPDPEFYYRSGGGPMFDMGPYYVSAFVNLLGPVLRVAALACQGFSERLAPRDGELGRTIPVTVPTHVTGLIEFAAGQVATIVTSFDVGASEVPRFEVYGTEGTLNADPSNYGGRVRIRRWGNGAWADMPLRPGYALRHRGLGVAEMAVAMRHSTPHRTSAEIAYHVLEVLCAFQTSWESREYVQVTSTFTRPEPLGPLSEYGFRDG